MWLPAVRSLQPRSAPVDFDDRAADRQSHAHAAGLGRVERVEQLIEARRVEPGP